MEDKSILNKMSKNCILLAKDLSWQNKIEKLQIILENILKLYASKD